MLSFFVGSGNYFNAKNQQTFRENGEGEKAMPSGRSYSLVAAGLLLSAGFFLLFQHQIKKSESQAEQDVAVVMGNPVPLRKSDSYIVAYPVFLRGAEIHTLMDARKISRIFREGEEVQVLVSKNDFYGVFGLPYIIKPISP